MGNNDIRIEFVAAMRTIYDLCQSVESCAECPMLKECDKIKVSLPCIWFDD